ncbi:hypothetical protein [Psychrobacillus phage Perkons]|nr:hypothetical protein [Psychrobacillus phage Perkons]
MQGTMSLIISKNMNLSADEEIAKFDELNIKSIRTLEVELMDGSLHRFRVNDFFTDWE